MSTLVSLVLGLFGAGGLVAGWNALHPFGDPRRRYSISWLPAMVATELAPQFLVVQAVVLAGGLALGGGDNVVLVGAGFVVAAMAVAGVVVVRSLVGVRRLRPLVDGVVHPARGWARLTGRPIPTPPGVTEHHGIVWADGLTLDLIRPAVASGPGSGPVRLPVCVYVHGGGWTGGEPQTQGRDLYHALALAGCATATIRYPLAPQASVEEQVAAVRAAVRWTRTGLADHGIEAGTVVLAGGSAGAHLASLAALTPAHPDDRVDGVVGLYGVYDMANRNQLHAPWPKVRSQVMKASVEEAPERYRALSPLDQIHDATPPVLLVHGTNDTLVPLAESEQFAAALAQAGRPVELVPVLGVQHGFNALSSIASRMVAALVRDWLTRTVVGAPRPEPEARREG